MRDVTFLASPELGGRGFASPGLERAAKYVADGFAAAKLEPGGEGGTYFQPFAARGGAVLHCSHMLDVVENTAHRIAVLDKGKLLACGTANDLRTQAGAGADEHLDDVFRSLVQASDPAAAAKAILGD